MKFKVSGIFLSFILLTGNVSGLPVTDNLFRETVQEEMAEEQKTELEQFLEQALELQKHYPGFPIQQEADITFQTGRLLVKAEETLDSHGAAEVLQYKNFYILQYGSPEEAKSAWQTLQEKQVCATPDMRTEDYQETEETAGQADGFGTTFLEQDKLSVCLSEKMGENAGFILADNACRERFCQDAGAGTEVYSLPSENGNTEQLRSLLENYLALLELEDGKTPEINGALLSATGNMLKKNALFSDKIRSCLEHKKLILFFVPDESEAGLGYELATPDTAVTEKIQGTANNTSEKEKALPKKERVLPKKENEKREDTAEESISEKRESEEISEDSWVSVQNPKMEWENASKTQITQDSDTIKLPLGWNQTLDKNLTKTGYTLKKVNEVACTHTVNTLSGSIKCKKAKNPLNPTKKELQDNIVLTGKLKGKGFTKTVSSYNAGGVSNTVSHLRLSVNVNATGVGSRVLAEPYVCPDTYAAYSYFERHFSYCPNTSRFYHTGSSHVWLGCTRGDVGQNEYHFQNYLHNFNVYQLYPNNYTVKYNANGGVGAMANQNVTYDQIFALNANQYTYPGYTFTGWSTTPQGAVSYSDGQPVANLTSAQNGSITLYAQWTPNTLTVRYHANGGTVSGTPYAIWEFANNWNYITPASAPEKFSSFGLTRTGYSKREYAEWNTRADGLGIPLNENGVYPMLTYAPDLSAGNREVLLYAQWTPNIYTVTLDRRLSGLSSAGTGTVYEKYDNGWYLNPRCTDILKDRNRTGKIAIPVKTGYIFQGYYTDVTGGTQMIDARGVLTAAGTADYRLAANTTWYAHYSYQISCEDYADIPCDLEKTPGDTRENTGILVYYNTDTGKTEVKAGQRGITAVLTGQPAGTEIGDFQSLRPGTSSSGISGNSQTAILSIIPEEQAAYQLTVTAGGKPLCSRMIYFKDRRYRTSAKLGTKGTVTAEHGTTLAGSNWGVSDPAYTLYQYTGCTELRNIQAPGTVYRYFSYKNVNMAYSGNGATSGTNILEQNVSLEDGYQFRDNEFTKVVTEKKKTSDGQKYKCDVKYHFEEWNLSSGEPYQEKEQRKMNHVYQKAYEESAISSHTTEDINTYQTAEPAFSGSLLDLSGKAKGARPGGLSAEYINLQPKWNAFPTIVVAPGESLEFYEGEDVTKENIICHLIAHDNEDNDRSKQPYIPDLNDSLKIIKTVYPKPMNGSQEAYEKNYEEDVPEDFLLDTYYLKLEKDETVDVLVTFSVTDSSGNTTEETFPVKIKYNNYPEISSEDVFYYFKEEANKGEITADVLSKRATAEDVEDGDISSKLGLKDFDPQVIKMQTESKTEFSITYQVTDAYKKTTCKTITLMIWDEDAVIAEMPKYYVRYISEKYLDTLEENSSWREPENLAYLTEILNNETPVETWEFSHEDVAAVQGWITERGEGNWKIGQESNREFLNRFAHCKQ